MGRSARSVGMREQSREGEACVQGVARERRRADRPPSKCVEGYIYLVNMGRQGILCLLAVRDGMGVAT
jgi:hypothetical protein